MMSIFKQGLLFVVAGFCFLSLKAQPSWTLNPFGKEKKPEQYEDKKLGSEKTADKKFTFFRHFTQNNITRYNYYFNANNKVRFVVDNARFGHKDDYTKLLSFYPYDVEGTVSQKSELDSVIIKSTAGILLHDLRNDWVDNMYFLIGKAYYFSKEFDSAALTFQFINYNLFPRKKNEDDDRVVGGASGQPGSMLSIADKEKRNIIQRMFTLPPSRNDALIWLARTYIESGSYGDASGMINILNADPNLPKRLRDDLEEMSAYFYYRQEMYDSSAVHLEKALTNAESKEDRARWQYLLAQMYEMKKNYVKASDYYLKAAKKTVNPEMDIFAHLYDAKMNAGNGKELDKNIANLKKMAKRDKYSAYRDIIFNAAGELSLSKPDTVDAIAFFKKSIQYNENNLPYKNKSFLALANIAYDLRDYRNAAAYYDSLVIPDASLGDDIDYINDRKAVLGRVVQLMTLVEVEDSLQRMALLTPAQRDAKIKQIVKKYNKENNVVAQEESTGTVPISLSSQSPASMDLFTSSSKGEWYFYNTNLRSKGLTDFKMKWGKRSNVDNWRRSSSLSKNINANINIDEPSPDAADSASKGGTGLVPFSYDAIMAELPLTEDKLDSSNTRIAKALLDLAGIFQNELLDYPEAIRTYEEYMTRFGGTRDEAEALLGLFYCYNKLGMADKAAYYKNKLLTAYAESNAAKMLTNPKLTPESAGQSQSERYQKIYSLFVEGKFAEAIAEKKIADSLFGEHYWTPQLLYLEAVYYVKERQDSLAIIVLDNIITLFPTSPLKEKAELLKSVLERRKEIEEYLATLEITREEEETAIISDPKKVQVTKEKDTDSNLPVISIAPSSRPTIALDSVQDLPEMSYSGFLLQPDEPHLVIMIMDKVDAVYVNEAINAFNRFNRENAPYRNISIQRDALNSLRPMLLFSTLQDAAAALEYCDKLKKSAPSTISWLQPSKYIFLMITQKNLALLKQNRDAETYRALLLSQYPGKF